MPALPTIPFEGVVDIPEGVVPDQAPVPTWDDGRGNGPTSAEVGPVNVDKPNTVPMPEMPDKGIVDVPMPDGYQV